MNVDRPMPAANDLAAGFDLVWRGREYRAALLLLRALGDEASAQLIHDFQPHITSEGLTDGHSISPGEAVELVDGLIAAYDAARSGPELKQWNLRRTIGTLFDLRDHARAKSGQQSLARKTDSLPDLALNQLPLAEGRIKQLNRIGITTIRQLAEADPVETAGLAGLTDRQYASIRDTVRRYVLAQPGSFVPCFDRLLENATKVFPGAEIEEAILPTVRHCLLFLEMHRSEDPESSYSRSSLDSIIEELTFSNTEDALSDMTLALRYRWDTDDWLELVKEAIENE